MIKLLIIGHLGNDALLKEINGKNVISFNVAHSEKFKDQQGMQKEKTTWVSCSYWTDRTAIAPYLKKGTQVFVEGTPEADTYLNKDGQNVSVLRLRVLHIQLLGSGTREAGQQNNADGSSNGTAVGQLESAEAGSGGDDLPF